MVIALVGCGLSCEIELAIGDGLEGIGSIITKFGKISFGMCKYEMIKPT